MLQELIEPRQCHGSICVKDVLYMLDGFVRHDAIGSEPITTDNDLSASDNEASTTEGEPVVSASVHSMMMVCGSWQHESDMPLAVCSPKVANINDTVYLLDEDTKKLLQMDAGKVWSECAPCPAEGYCYGVSMTSITGRLFVAGGGDMICACYSPETNTWCTGQRPLRSHHYGALAYRDDKLLFLGGSYDDGTDKVEEYNIDEDRWQMCSYKMPQELHSHHAFTLSM